MSDTCLFCKIARRELDAAVVYEDDRPVERDARLREDACDGLETEMHGFPPGGSARGHPSSPKCAEACAASQTAREMATSTAA
mgnify:CR=1 FL=1